MSAILMIEYIFEDSFVNYKKLYITFFLCAIHENNLTDSILDCHGVTCLKILYSFRKRLCLKIYHNIEIDCRYSFKNNN